MSIDDISSDGTHAWRQRDAELHQRIRAAIATRDPKAATTLAGSGRESARGKVAEVVIDVLHLVRRGEDPAADIVDAALRSLPPAEAPAPSWAAELGITEHVGADALADNARGAREGAGSDIDELPALIEAGGEHALAFDPLRVAAAFEMRANDGPGFILLRTRLKCLKKFPMTAWVQAIDAHGRKAKAEAKAETDAERKREAAARREAAERARAENSLRLEEARAAADDARAAHYAEAEVNGVTYRSQPGLIEMEETSPKGEVKVTQLSNFSAPIVGDTYIIDAPEAEAPRRVLTLAVQVNDQAPREVDIPAETLVDMKWVETLCPGAIVRGARPVRDHLRLALQELSADVTVTRRRHGFVGWHKVNGVWVYLNAGTILGAGGAVAGVEAKPSDPGHRFWFPPPPSAAELREASLPLVLVANFGSPLLMGVAFGLAARAVMGPCNVVGHVSGEPSFGKSAAGGIVQSCHGPTMHGDKPPMSWSDSSTPKGMVEALRTVGDAVMMVDDFKRFGGHRDIEVTNKFDMVTRSVFNGSVPRKLQMDGKAFQMLPPRCPILSTGEVDVPGFSTKDRLVTVHLATKNPDPRPLREMGLRGDLARGWAGYVVWYASRYEAKRGQLAALAQDVGARWGLTGRDRAVTQLGQIALGWENLLEYLGESGAVDAHQHGDMLGRVKEALRAVAAENGQDVEEEHPGPRYVQLIAGALRSGKAHAIEITPTGAKIPANPESMGYLFINGEWQPRGERIAYLHHSHKGVVFLDPEPARNVASEQALRAGNPLTVDDRALGAALRSAGVLALTGADEGRPNTPKFRLRLRSVGGEGRAAMFAVRAEALGLDFEPGAAPDDGPQDAGAASDDPVPEFPADLL
ncbi:MAG: hypothetical protein JWM10_4092 [Myxococcaceae bacterium]|nr:hypothetical protein [Myxococcaceae bacterium]